VNNCQRRLSNRYGYAPCSKPIITTDSISMFPQRTYPPLNGRGLRHTSSYPSKAALGCLQPADLVRMRQQNEQCQSKFCMSHHISFKGDRTAWEHRIDDCVTGRAIVRRAVVGLYFDSQVVRASCQGIHALGGMPRGTVVLPPETRLQWRLSIPMQR
jgi:hypothetical protein